MEVDRTAFYPLLLDLLTDISTSHFVAFDLELSGVPAKSAKNSTGQGKQSLQDRYLEIKAAAERYQILQIGLTCVEQDVDGKKYILKPYNFELSPLVEESRIEIERDFTFSSSAVDFLQKNGFDMSLAFRQGIPYLSRVETKEARKKFHQRQDRTNIADIQIKSTEVESLAFLERVRGQIAAWLAIQTPDSIGYIDIGRTKAEYAKENVDPTEGLSRYEKRLVHQLVRAEYPELRTISKRDVIQIIHFDQSREDRHLADRLNDLNERINRQKGFRWVIEALNGGLLTDLDLRECARDPVSGEHIYADMDEYRAQFHRAQNIVKGNPRLMVGHNCFLDLVYIYNTFIGPLPDTVEQFQDCLHQIWPAIVDTKYMSTHNCGDISPASSLEQMATQLSFERTPILEIDKEHMAYAQTEALHEAGYDSFLTAQIMLRLSAKLEREGTYVELDGTADAITTGTKNLNILDTPILAVNNGEALIPSPPGPNPNAAADEFVPSEKGGKWKRIGDPSLPPPRPDDPFSYNPADLKHQHYDAAVFQSFEGGMPRRRSAFWSVYGNKLRVFGTEEGICVLDGSDRQGEEGDDEEGVEIGSGGVSVSETGMTTGWESIE